MSDQGRSVPRRCGCGHELTAHDNETGKCLEWWRYPDVLAARECACVNPWTPVENDAPEDPPSESVWIDRGDPDCDGEPRWTQDKSGKRTFTCPECSLHWYYVIPPSAP